MRARVLEIRYHDEVYSVMALEMSDDVSEFRNWLLARSGFPREQYKKYVVIVLDTMKCHVDPAGWPEQWQRAMHGHVVDHFDVLYDGKVIDVDHLMTGRDKPRLSSRAI